MIPGAPDAEVILGSGPKSAEGGASTSLVATEGWEEDCHIVPRMEEILHQLVTIGNGKTR